VSSSSSGGSSSLDAALSRLQDLCCLDPKALAGAVCSDMVLQTTASLARLVAAAVLAGRLQLQGSNSSSSSSSGSSSSAWQQLAQVPDVWTLPASYKLAWRAAWHWLLQAAPESPAAAAGTTHDLENIQQQQQQQQPRPARPRVFTGSLQPSSGSMIVRLNPTPDLAVILMTEAAAAELMDAQVMPGGVPSDMMRFNAMLGSGDQQTPQVGLRPAGWILSRLSSNAG
jgi:hypothetical protein